MFKNRNTSDTKQRFTIRKYHFGAASVLLGTFFTLGGSVASAEKVDVQESNSVVKVPVVEKSVPVLETTATQTTEKDLILTTTEAPTTSTVETTEAPKITTEGEKAKTREVTIKYLIKHVDEKGQVVRTEEKSVTVEAAGSEKGQTFVTVNGEIKQVFEGETNEFTVVVKSEKEEQDKKEETPEAKKAEEADSVAVKEYKYTVEYRDAVTDELISTEEKVTSEEKITETAKPIVVSAANKPFVLVKNEVRVKDILLNQKEGNKVVFKVEAMPTRNSRPRNEGQEFGRQGTSLRNIAFTPETINRTIRDGRVTSDFTVTRTHYHIPIGETVKITRDSNIRVLATSSNGMTHRKEQGAFKRIYHYHPDAVDTKESGGQKVDWTAGQAFGIIVNHRDGYFTNSSQGTYNKAVGITKKADSYVTHGMRVHLQDNVDVQLNFEMIKQEIRMTIS
ncbi:MAG: YSIRK-type signal peptide-containing protein [Gemella sp.]|nr:YSIRK-type signal peptide-containing protein [Gemella sp.]